VAPEAPAIVIQTAYLGDVVLTTGLLEAAAEVHGSVDVLVTPAALPLVETHPAVRQALVYDKRGRDRGVLGFRRIVARLSERGYGRCYLAHRSFRSAALAWAARIPERIGFADAPARWLYTRRMPRPKDGHEAERLQALVDGIDHEARIRLGLTADDRDAAYAWLAAHGVGDGFVAMAPGARWGGKRWGGYPELARILKEPIVVLGGPDEAALARELVDAAPERVASAADQPLRVAAAILERAGVLVTNDSAPLHLASAVGTPVVAIFGPTVPAFGFGPRSPTAAVVERAGLKCRPCSLHGPKRCPLGHHRCMREIPASAVLEAVEALTR